MANIMQSTKYTISLDDLDLGLLPTNFMMKYDNVAPLWMKSNLHFTNNNYYEFEIQNSTSLNEEKEQTTNVFCHICNIEVPKPYLKQHYDSPKHDVNMKIAETAMERIKKSLKHSSFNNEVADSSSHFCPTCVVVVKQEDRIKHEKSITHKNAVIVEKFLQDFYLIYNNDMDNHETDNAQANTNEVEDIMNDNHDQNIEIFSMKETIVNGNGSCSDENDEDHYKTEPVISMENDSYKETKDENDSEVKTKKSKKKLVKSKNICNIGFSINDEDFPLLTQDVKGPVAEYKFEESSDQTKILSLLNDVDNFLNHIVIRSNNLFCLVCKIGIYNEASIFPHLSDLDHTNNYQSILREQFLLPNDDQTFCAACNVSFVRKLELTHCEDMKHITKHEIYLKKMERLAKDLEVYKQQSS